MRNILLIIVLIMTVMLFTHNPLDNSFRLFQGLWNTGHLFFFALLTWLLITQTRLLRFEWLKMLVVCVLFSVVLGALIEVLQFFTGRYMGWQDLFTDMLGGLLGFLLVQFSLPIQRRSMSKPIVVLLSTGVLLVAFYPVFKIIQDNLKIEAVFPVIANFESEETLQRWDREEMGRFELDYQLFTEGKSSALVEFSMGPYPGASLEAIYPHWSDYNYLNLSIHNDQAEVLKIEVKIFDRLHRQTGYQYADRFNHEVSLRPGWNTLQIKLKDVLEAPRDRRMNLDDIAGFSVFIHNPDEIKSVHLDNIYLSR